MKIKKLLAIGIVFLFIGVAVTPGVYGEFIKETTNNKLININVEFFKNIKKESQNVSLINKTYQQLLLYLDSLEQRLSKIKTRTETVKVFEEALAYFDSIGLFGSNSIEKVRELVFSKNIHKDDLARGKTKKIADVRYNILNLVACRCGGNVWYGPIGWFLYWSFGFIDLFILSFLYWNFPKLRQIIENLANSQDKILNSLENFASNNPFAFLYYVTAWLYGEPEWIFSIGLLGVFFLHNLNFTRVSNCAFTGLKIHLADGSTFFFGSSLLLEVG